jgi:hypothetical protein
MNRPARDDWPALLSLLARRRLLAGEADRPVGVPWLDCVCQADIGVALVVLAWWLLFDRDRRSGWRKRRTSAGLGRDSIFLTGRQGGLAL